MSNLDMSCIDIVLHEEIFVNRFLPDSWPAADHFGDIIPAHPSAILSKGLFVI